MRLDPSASQAAFAEFPSSGSEDILKQEPWTLETQPGGQGAEI